MSAHKCPPGIPEDFFVTLEQETQILVQITFSKMDEDCRVRIIEVVSAPNPLNDKKIRFLTAMMTECKEMERRTKLVVDVKFRNSKLN